MSRAPTRGAVLTRDGNTWEERLAGEGYYLVGLGYVGGYGFGEVGVEFVGVFFYEEIGNALFCIVEGGAFGVDGCGAVH